MSESNGHERRTATPPAPQTATDIEHEMLGGLLRANKYLDEVSMLITPTMLSTAAHQVVFAAMLELHAKRREVDLVTLADHLQKTGKLDDLGKHPYGFIGEFADIPSGANCITYAGIVKDRYLTQRLAEEASVTLDEATHRRGDLSSLLHDAEQRIQDVARSAEARETISLQTALSGAADAIDMAHMDRGHLAGIPSGWFNLDEITGGFRPCELTIIGARPSVGKTSMAVGIARHVMINEKRPVYFVSLEQDYIDVGIRMILAQGRVDSNRCRKGLLNDAEQERMQAARDAYDGCLMEIASYPQQKAAMIVAGARRFQRRFGLAVIIVDYLQLVEPDNRKETRQEQVAGVSRRLKALARDIHCPVLAMAQLNRELENRSGQEPRLSDLRESGGIEADADVVMLLWKESEAPNVLQVRVAKNRNGPTGDTALAWDATCMRIDNKTDWIP